MKTNFYITLMQTTFCFFVTCFLVGCFPSSRIQRTPTAVPNGQDILVPSLKGFWPKIEEMASRWHSDAYLFKANIAIQIEPILTQVMAIEFRSRDNQNETLGIFIDKNGQITSQVFYTEMPLYQKEPIIVSEILDSPDALRILLTKDDINFLYENIKTPCSQLILDHTSIGTSTAATWTLRLSNCTSEYAPPNWKTISIDAVTGNAANENK